MYNIYKNSRNPKNDNQGFINIYKLINYYSLNQKQICIEFNKDRITEKYQKSNILLIINYRVWGTQNSYIEGNTKTCNNFIFSIPFFSEKSNFMILSEITVILNNKEIDKFSLYKFFDPSQLNSENINMVIKKKKKKINLNSKVNILLSSNEEESESDSDCESIQDFNIINKNIESFDDNYHIWLSDNLEEFNSEKKNKTKNIIKNVLIIQKFYRKYRKKQHI